MKNCIDCGAPLLRARKGEWLRLCATCIDHRGIESLEAFAARLGIGCTGVGHHRKNGLPTVRVGGKFWIPITEALQWLDANKRKPLVRDWHRDGVDTRPGIIYALRCPKTKRVRYIGKTGTTLATRFYMHLAEARKNRSRPVLNWIRKLAREGLKPIPETLQECLPGMMDASEQEWIAQYRADGVKLLNIREGGEGGPWSEEGRRQHSERCAETNRRLADDPKWQAANEQGAANRRGMTVHEYRDYREERRTVQLWNQLLNKYHCVFAKAKGNCKQRRSEKRRRIREARGWERSAIQIEGNIAYLPLTQGQIALIDAEDIPRISKWKWAAQWHRNGWRAKRTINDGTYNKRIELLSWRIADRKMGQMVTIINGNSLDCRKSNLRVLDQASGKPDYRNAQDFNALVA